MFIKHWLLSLEYVGVISNGTISGEDSLLLFIAMNGMLKRSKEGYFLEKKNERSHQS